MREREREKKSKSKQEMKSEVGDYVPHLTYGTPHNYSGTNLIYFNLIREIVGIHVLRVHEWMILMREVDMTSAFPLIWIIMQSLIEWPNVLATNKCI